MVLTCEYEASHQLFCAHKVSCQNYANCIYAHVRASYNSQNMKFRICHDIVVVCEYCANNTANQCNGLQ